MQPLNVKMSRFSRGLQALYTKTKQYSKNMHKDTRSNNPLSSTSIMPEEQLLLIPSDALMPFPYYICERRFLSIPPFLADCTFLGSLMLFP